MRTKFLLFILFLAAASSGIVAAEDDALFLSTGSGQYQFMPGEESRIPVQITNNMGRDVPGTMVIRLKDPLTGEYSSSQSKQITAFSGEEIYYVSAGNAGEGTEYIVDISFEYGNGPVYSSDLPGISLSFSNEVPQDEDTPEAEETASAPVKSSSGIKAETQDTTSYASGTTPDGVQASEEYSDAEALKRTLLEEQIERELRKNALTAAIKSDPVFRGVNGSLYDQNFSRLSLAVNAGENNSGVFSSLYRDEHDATVSLSGTVHEGVIEKIFENTTAFIALPPVFMENETFGILISQTESEGFVRSGTEINISSDNSDITILYTKGIYAAEIRAESVNGSVKAVSIRKDDILPFYVLPLLILIFACLNAIVIYFYYMYRPDPSGTGNATEEFADIQDFYGTDALHATELLFFRGHRKEAVSMAVRVLRMKVAAERFSGKEISDSECRAYLLEHTDQHNSEQTISILTATERQRYSGEEITEAEFRTLIAEIRSLIQD
ncbi:hypothetical protein L1S32_11900 [Methanogenium sp. S4BF]|uniref:hypothetical protein n=1 Tax=Methanogenium sp. S4BF TaxID=1789226 RepID=UPI0024162E84|nr:hypothetical protein [Methanogenium sp. S4BF]WFN34525.1 hypothetical protein L1S32_11900 [Methanogenium sp. S4BF]